MVRSLATTLPSGSIIQIEGIAVTVKSRRTGFSGPQSLMLSCVQGILCSSIKLRAACVENLFREQTLKRIDYLRRRSAARSC